MATEQKSVPIAKFKALGRATVNYSRIASKYKAYVKLEKSLTEQKVAGLDNLKPMLDEISKYSDEADKQVLAFDSEQATEQETRTFDGKIYALLDSVEQVYVPHKTPLFIEWLESLSQDQQKQIHGVIGY